MSVRKTPEILDKVVDLVLAYRPKPKSEAANARTKAAKKLAKEVAREITAAEGEVDNYVREREASIRKGARRAGKRFRL